VRPAILVEDPEVVHIGPVLAGETIIPIIKKIKRKLTAILSSDVKGYSRLMGEEW
jgi:hypothetical protein